MDNNYVVQQIVDVVRKIQESSGRAAGSIGPSTSPVGDLDGFDSLNGVEATVELSASLGTDLPDGLFVYEGGTGGTTIGQIAERILSIVGEGVLAG